MKLRNKKTGKTQTCDMVVITDEPIDGEIARLNRHTFLFRSIEQFNDEYEAYKPKEPLIKDEKIRKAVRAWADVLEIDEAEFYGAETWIGFRSRDSRTGWLSKFEVDCFGSDNTLVPFRRYTIAELCGEVTDEA